MSNTDTPESRYPEFDPHVLHASAKDAIKAALKLRTLIRNQYRAGFMTGADYWEAVEMLSLIDAHADKAIFDTGLLLARRDLRVAAEKANRSKATECEQRVFDVIERADKAVSPVELAEATGMPVANIGSYLRRLMGKKLVVKESRGLYRLPSADDSD